MSFPPSPGAILALLVLLFLKEPERTAVAHDKAHIDKGTVLSLFKNKAYLAAILGYAAVTFSLGGISNWMASFLQRITGYSQEAATSAMGPIIVVGGLGGTIVGGIWAQRWSKKTPARHVLRPRMERSPRRRACAALLLRPEGDHAARPCRRCLFIFLGTGPVNASTLNSVPANLRSTAMAGQLLVIHLFGDMSSPTIIGFVSDHSNLRVGLAATLVTMLLAAIIFFVGARWAPTLHHSEA